MNTFKDLFAAARDVFGGRSETVQKTRRQSRQTPLNELRREAHRIGASSLPSARISGTASTWRN
ncbi:heavy metal-binding domain-containing protein [Paracoccus ravus]|uniref:heavy metal-binding domain-containing protein n=1 Tax=Paracoccus ravus TaxID=2447760 RepID=UPI001FD71A1C|nr:heavy metal-binding domain-containing protein [Paracoccus ravus]